MTMHQTLVIPHKSTGLRESGLLAAFAPEILRCAQDDSLLHFVILSAAKDLLRTYGESPDHTNTKELS